MEFWTYFVRSVAVTFGAVLVLMVTGVFLAWLSWYIGPQTPEGRAANVGLVKPGPVAMPETAPPKTAAPPPGPAPKVEAPPTTATPAPTPSSKKGPWG